MTAASLARRGRIAPILTATVLTVLLLWLVGAAAEVFLLLFAGILVGLYLDAVTDALVERLGIPRSIAFTLAILATLAAITGLLLLLVPPVVEQTRQLITVLPAYIESWELAIDRQIARVPALAAVWKPGEHTLLLATYDQLTALSGDIVPKVFGLFHAWINVFAVAVIGVYIGLHPAFYREWLIVLFPPLHRDLVRDVLADLSRTLRSWIVGQLIGMTILAALTAVGLWALGVPYWLTFGIFTGAAAIVPYFGSLVSTVLPALFVLNQPDGATRAVLVIILGIVIHVVEGNVVLPLIFSKGKLKLPPVLTIMAVLIFAKLLGAVGLLVAVPALAVLTVVVQRILVNRIYEGQGFRRAPRDRALLLRVPVPDGGVMLPEGPPPDVVAVAEREDGGRRIA